ncbi:MAG: YbaB/EbfC family nucleoid-associated protein [Anaerofustis stercorihominis]|nr:YbaB/EbfC family nucleoid-associated protein [Anaerofustis stercorihominis]
MGKYSNKGNKGLGGGANMQSLLKQAQKMQEQMQKAQEEILSAEYEATSGGGAVKVVVGGDKFIRSLEIEADVVDPEDVEMLTDLVTAAVNEALRQVDLTTQEKMGAIQGGMPMM